MGDHVGRPGRARARRCGGAESMSATTTAHRNLMRAFDFQFSGFGFRVSSFSFRVSGFRFRVLGFGFMV